MHNEKGYQNELLEEYNSDREMFVHYKFYKYFTSLYKQTICFRLVNLEDESRDTFERLKVLVQDNEEYLFKNLKILWLGYGYFSLALLEKTNGWNEEKYDIDLWTTYLEKAKFYLAADRKDEELQYQEFSETMDFDELADSYIYNAYAHLITGDIGEFKSSIYASGMELDDWEIVKKNGLRRVCNWKCLS